MDSFTISGNIADISNKAFNPGTLIIKNGLISEIKIEPGEKYGVYILPGFIDAHVHVESSMLPPSEFARLAVIHGTVAAVSDPHEIANVLGMAGLDFMLENSNKAPFRFYFGAPSCVPATSFESSGAELKPSDIEDLLKRDEIKYLSEMMNFPGVIYDFPDVMEKLTIAKQYRKPVDGHAPGLSGELLEKYVKAGISTDHECFTFKEAEEKIRLGMKILIREGSAANNFEELYPLIDKYPDMCMLCSDDKHPDNLLAGHINQLAAWAVKNGSDFWNVLKAASVNPVAHYKLESGLLKTGDSADFIIVENLKDFHVIQTFVKGVMVSENGKTLIEKINVEPVNIFRANKKKPDDFKAEAGKGLLRVIEALDGQLITNEIFIQPRIESGFAVSDPDNDILKISVINRYSDERPSVGFIKNFGIKKGALASSVGHDSHNIIAVGACDESICEAVNAVIEGKGGMAVTDGAGRIEFLRLSIAGLMSREDGFIVAAKYSEIDKFAKELGSKLKAPFMTLSFMALLVIPKLKLSDKGLFDAEKFEFTNLFTG